jgi:Bacterial tandem repeat domain 1
VIGSHYYPNQSFCFDDPLSNEGQCDGSNTGILASPLTKSNREGTFAAIWVKGGGTPWGARHGLPSLQYQQAFDQLVGLGYRLVDVTGYALNNTAWYAGIWELRPGPAWQAVHGLDSAQYQTKFDQLAAAGYRLIRVAGYEVNGHDLYAAIWEQKDGPAWQARHGLTSAEYQQAFNDLTSQGYRLTDVSGYTSGGQERYAAIWELREGPAWQARHGLDSFSYQTTFNQLAQEGYRLIRVSGSSVQGSHRYAAIWEKSDGSPWVAFHGVEGSRYQQAFDELTAKGYRLVDVSGY